MENKTNRTISIEAFVSAGEDLFPIILDVQKMLQKHNISSLTFISDVLSTTSRVEQYDIIIDILKNLREIETNRNLTQECIRETDLPYPIDLRKHVKYNSEEMWRGATEEGTIDE